MSLRQASPRHWQRGSSLVNVTGGVAADDRPAWHVGSHRSGLPRWTKMELTHRESPFKSPQWHQHASERSGVPSTGPCVPSAGPGEERNGGCQRGKQRGTGRSQGQQQAAAGWQPAKSGRHSQVAAVRSAGCAVHIAWGFLSQGWRPKLESLIAFAMAILALFTAPTAFCRLWQLEQ